MIIPTEAHWRESARSPKFFVVDARAAFPLVLFLLHIKIWTFLLALIATAFFAVLESYGITLAVFLRILITFFGGNVKYVNPIWKE